MSSVTSTSGSNTGTASSSTTSQPVVTIANGASGAAGGSVINVSELVSQLVAATQAPQAAVISSQTQNVTTQISAVGTLKGALSTFQQSLSAIDSPTAFNAELATSSNTAAFTATADSDAVGGTYGVSISQLAQAEQLVSKAFAGGGSATVGTGTLQLSLGGTNFDVTINSSNDTVAGVAAAINAASGNPGITATVITGTDGAHLVLSSTLTGATNQINVAETDSSSGLASLTYGSSNTANYTQDSAAQDAQFTISGIAYTSSSNTVTDALNGVTLQLLAPTAASSSSGSSGSGSTSAPAATLTIASDTATIAGNIGTFVTAYNTLVGALSQLSSFDPTTDTAGPMLGDALLNGIQNEIRSTLYSVVNTGSSTYNSLASVGITTNSDGTLSLNNATLQTALATDPSAVSTLFSSANGVAATLNSQLTAELASGGSIDSRSQTLVQQENALTAQQNQLNQQMTALTASLTQQYSSLNTLLSSLQSTSAYLTQQFQSLPLVQGQAEA